jgi:hypothetical protein
VGAALYPDPQWGKLSGLWASFYPLKDDLTPQQRGLIAPLERTMPEFVRVMLTHRPAALRGKTLLEALRGADRSPARLRAEYDSWRGSFERMRSAKPSRVFAALGQARADGKLAPETEGRLLADLLTYWALRQALSTKEFVTVRQVARPARAVAG